jgi:asparagine synthase (glutamine-hydrolysing)
LTQPQVVSHYIALTKTGLGCRMAKFTIIANYALQLQITNSKRGSDCEVILALYQEKGADFIDELNGIFGFVVYDAYTKSFLIARDHMGIIPLYYGFDQNGTRYVASELKALEGVCHTIEVFPPGHYMTEKDDSPQRWYTRGLGRF